MSIDDFPKTALEFDERFSSEEACRAYLIKVRWPEGFRCAACGGKKACCNGGRCLLFRLFVTLLSTLRFCHTSKGVRSAVDSCCVEGQVFACRIFTARAGGRVRRSKLEGGANNRSKTALRIKD